MDEMGVIPGLGLGERCDNRGEVLGEGVLKEGEKTMGAISAQPLPGRGSRETHDSVVPEGRKIDGPKAVHLAEELGAEGRVLKREDRAREDAMLVKVDIELL